MEESKELKNLFYFFQAIIYATIIIEVIMFVDFNISPKLNPLLNRVAKIGIYQNIFYSKLFTFFFIIITSIGTKPKKDHTLDHFKKILVPLVSGFIFFFGSGFLLIHAERNVNILTILYIAFSILGAILCHIALDNISKIIKSNLMKDRFNIENESFEQTRNLVENEYSVNIPMKFYFKKKWNRGFVNIINPFRGNIIIGPPGSGKSFTFINSYIKQHSKKKFALVVYDQKYPELSETTYYHYLKNKQKGIIKDFDFNVINFSEPEYSKRVNPLKKEYIEFLADAMETSEGLYESLQKGDRTGGNAEFFKTSAVNFMGACIYFFSRYKGGIYSDPPHVLSFINRSYSEIFEVLFSEPELHSILSPFKTAFENKAFDQLEGMVGSLKVQIARLATKESYWIFSGNDFDLKISNKEKPSYLIIASNAKTQSMNSALNALILNRLTKQINSRGNVPTSIIVDEAPTLYFYQLANLLSTARSNKVSVILGIQEISQLEEQYGKASAKTIMSVIGNVFAASARNKDTLEWLSTLFGKVVQVKESVTINRDRESIQIQEGMDNLIPAGKISNLQTGEIVGLVSLDFGKEKEFVNTVYHCKTNINTKKIKKEEKNYPKMPKIYNFGTPEQREKILQKNFERINREVDEIIREYV